MNSPATYQYIHTAATTVVGNSTYRRVNLKGISVNTALTGTLTVKSGSTTIGVFAIGTAAGTYWWTCEGIEVQDLQLVTSAGDDVTVFYTNL